MDKILMKHDDVNSLGVVLYEKYIGSDPVLYVDKDCTIKADVDALRYAFLRSGVVVLEQGYNNQPTDDFGFVEAYAKINSFTENALGAACVTYQIGLYESGVFTTYPHNKAVFEPDEE